MAIDTRDKRGSCIGIDSSLLPNPDGSLNQGDRQQADYSYRGITAAAPGGTTFIIFDRSIHRLVFNRIFSRIN